MYIAYSSTSSSTAPAAAEFSAVEEDTKYMDSNAPRISSNLRHLQIMT
jgi:hypothetical protein